METLLITSVKKSLQVLVFVLIACMPMPKLITAMGYLPGRATYLPKVDNK